MKAFTDRTSQDAICRAFDAGEWFGYAYMQKNLHIEQRYDILQTAGKKRYWESPFFSNKVRERRTS